MGISYVLPTSDQQICSDETNSIDQSRESHLYEDEMYVVDEYLNNDSIFIPVGNSIDENQSSNEEKEAKIFRISVQLQRSALILMDKFANEEGTTVNYKAMKKSQEFKEYTQIASQLRDMSLLTLTRMPDGKRLSFFANLYNALILHATCVLGAPKNTPQARSAFFSGMIHVYI